MADLTNEVSHIFLQTKVYYYCYFHFNLFISKINRDGLSVESFLSCISQYTTLSLIRKKDDASYSLLSKSTVNKRVVPSFSLY